jgi:hypothetical protein
MAATAGRAVRFNSSCLPLFVRSSGSGLRVWPWVCASLVGLLLSGGWVDRRHKEEKQTTADEFWRVARPVAIAVHQGRASVRVPARNPGSQVLVIVSSLSRAKGPFSVHLKAEAAISAKVPELAVDGAFAVPASRAESERTRQDLSRPHAPPAKERTFHMLVCDGDVYSPSNYVAIPAALRGAGQHIQVYVAGADLASVKAELVADIIHTFDDRIFPLMSSRFGPAPDVDGDGRFTVLLSSWLDHLGGGRYAVDGFVRVADLDLSFRSPLGNQCDMMYLSTTLESGPHLRTVMAHEYMHAVLVGQKGRSDGQASGPPREEEGWLDEAIAHLAEDCCGFSTSNIDYRVSAFLARPERYQLVVDDYYAADLFRSHGNRGSTYLFLRWCALRYGPDLIPALVHSRLRGATNLEGCTGSTFAGLYRAWTLDLIQDGREPGAANRGAANDRRRGETVRRQPPQWELAGPRVTHVVTGTVDRWTALGTTSHYAIVDGSTTGAIDTEVAGPPEAELQVTVLLLGDDRPRLDLSAVKIRGMNGEYCLRAQIKERNGVPVRLSLISWEPLAPGLNPRAAAACHGRLADGALEKTLGTSTLPASGELTSQPILLTGLSAVHGPLVVKVVGTDAQGRRVSAWADLALEDTDR